MQFNPSEWKGIAKGERLFILGNGPSLLTQMDLLPRLAGEHTMVCNGMAKWEALPFEPTYLVATDIPLYKWLDDVYGPQWKSTVRFNFQRSHFESHEGFLAVPTAQDHMQIQSHGMACLGDEFEEMRTGRTTPLTAAQLGVWMGYTDFIYLGIEQTRGYAWNPEQPISITGRAEFPSDKNPKYQHAVQRSAIRMREDLEPLGIGIFDSTPNGLLNARRDVRQRGVPVKKIWEYIPLEELF